MSPRNYHHLLWMIVAVATFTLGYFVGNSPGTPGRSQLPVSSATTVEEARAQGIDSPGETNSANIIREHGKSALNSMAASTGNDKPLSTLVERAAQAMLTGSDLRRQRAFEAVLEEMKPQDALAIHALLTSANSQGVTYVNQWEQFWTRWGEIDGTAAMKFVLNNQQGALQKDAARVMRGWGSTHPEEAAQWLEANQGHESFGSALLGLTDGYAGENLSGATSLALTAAPSGDPLLGRLMETLSEQAVRQGRLHGLTQWFESLPSGGEAGSVRAAALGHVYWRLWRADQDRALEWVQEQSSRPWRSDRLIGEVAQRVAEKDPAKAFNWLQAVPPSPRNGNYPGIEPVIKAWLLENVEAATRALESLPPSPFKDQALTAQQRLSATRTMPK